MWQLWACLFSYGVKMVIYSITQSKKTEVTVPFLPIKKNSDKGKYIKTEKLHWMPYHSICGLYRGLLRNREELLTLLEGIKGDFTEEMTLDFGLEGWVDIT